MRKTILLFWLLWNVLGFSQTTIAGKIVDTKGNAIEMANVYLEGTYDGAFSDKQGNFSFVTDQKANQNLVITALTFQTLNINIVIQAYQPQKFTLTKSSNVLEEVVITAGSFNAGSNTKTSVLKPLDIVTTAGAFGDIVGAFKTLPGVQQAPEDGRLLVRGGDSNEAQTYIDGLRVPQPYGSNAPNLPTRGRFSPFLFNGMTFSTGGFSAEFGDALSSVLLLNTINQPKNNKTNISLMTVGAGIGTTKLFKKSASSTNLSYINLAPYQTFVKQNVFWNKPMQVASGETVYRYAFVNGLLKVYAAFDYTNFSLNQNHSDYTNPVTIDTKNSNFYNNLSYKGVLGAGWNMQTGFSYCYAQNNIKIAVNSINNTEKALHFKLKLDKKISNLLKINFGADYFYTHFIEYFTNSSPNTFTNYYNRPMVATFAEIDWNISNNLALKTGVRNMYNHLLNKNVTEPRVSFAYKMDNQNQFSFASGIFHQEPSQEYLKYFTNFNLEKANHYMLNYSYTTTKRTIKTEIYYKQYNNLVKYDTPTVVYNSNFNNSGTGYAQGLDLFYRDSQTFKNLDYWLSYSYIDTKRNFKNYTSQVSPSFVANHTLSAVTKYWIPNWRSQLGLTYTFTSGRPYNNPNESVFMNQKTKTYNNLTLGWSYLLSPQKILYFSMSNLLGSTNIFGYQYSNTPNNTGVYTRQAITQPADRFFFVGFFWTISKDKNENELKNL